LREPSLDGAQVAITRRYAGVVKIDFFHEASLWSRQKVLVVVFGVVALSLGAAQCFDLDLAAESPLWSWPNPSKFERS
jgi:hypothetical protein